MRFPIGVQSFATFFVSSLAGAGVASWYAFGKGKAGEPPPEAGQVEIAELQSIALWIGVSVAAGWGLIFLTITVPLFLNCLLPPSASLPVHLPRAHSVATPIFFLLVSYLNFIYLMAILAPLRFSWGFWMAIGILGYLNLALLLQCLCLFSHPRLRSLPFLIFISWPASVYFSTILFSSIFTCFVPFLPFPVSPTLLAIPFLLACFGLWQSLSYSMEDVELRLQPTVYFPILTKLKAKTKPQSVEKEEEEAIADNQAKRVIRISQITDPHLGPFLSVERLQEICRQIVAKNPDIVLLTGDFYTLEGEMTPNSLSQALQPLEPLKGRLFACFGNHDLESDRAKRTTIDSLEAAGVTLLVNSQALLEIPGAGKVQIVGIDYYTPFHRSKITESVQALPIGAEVDLRIIMLHDPHAFGMIPDDDRSVVFSGHTHGGQIGLFSLGLTGWTIAGLMGPANGYWAHGYKRLYVGRGQGSRSFFGNFLVRLGVPPETAVLSLKW